MENREAYNQWSVSYDSVENKTRDLEARAIRTMLAPTTFNKVLELGAGTGKNTEWLAEKAQQVLAVDLSEAMLEKAKQKTAKTNIRFIHADISLPWDFTMERPDLVTCSLVLEHLPDIGFIFEQAAAVLAPAGHFYIGELHPFKQYQGSKARFEINGGEWELDCFIHHISDYLDAARQNGFSLVSFKEWFDEGSQGTVPRIASFLFEKK